MSDETVSNEEVQSTRERVEELRAELNDVNDQLAESEASRTNAVRKERLDREAASLEQQLEAARSRLQVSEEESPEEVLSGPEQADYTTYPIAKEGGWYQLSDGSNVQGEEAALEAQHNLDTTSGQER